MSVPRRSSVRREVQMEMVSFDFPSSILAWGAWREEIAIPLCKRTPLVTRAENVHQLLKNGF